MFIHGVTRSYTDSSGKALQQIESISADSEVNFDGLVPFVANTQVARAFTRANLKSLVIKSDQAITIYTNSPSGSSPTDTIPLVAGQVLLWTLATDTLTKCPFSADVTTLYISPTSVAANVSIRALEHQGA